MSEKVYHELAHLWPILTPPEDYTAEAARIRALVERHAPASSGRRSIMELGAGGGHTLHHLRDDFDCAAVDLSDAMLANCRTLNPDVETIADDMRTMRLGRTFDVVLVHDAIDYMTCEADSLAALQTAAAHLAPGGLVIAAPTYTTETFEESEMAGDATETDDASVGFVSHVHDPDPTDSTFEMTLFIQVQDATDDKVRVIEDVHVCGLFSEATWLSLMAQAGFEVVPLDAEDAEEPWELFLGVKR